MEIKDIEKNSKIKVYKKGDILFFAGEQPKKIIFLTEGKVEMFKNDSNGDEITIGIFSPLSLIAEMPTMNNIPYPATARCKEDCVIYEISINEEIFLALNLPVVKLFVDSLKQKIEKLEKIISYLTISNAKTRVAKYIYDNRINLNTMTQRQIASMLRLTPEGLSRIFKKLKNDGVIKTVSKKIIIVDVEKLEKMI